MGFRKEVAGKEGGTQIGEVETVTAGKLFKSSNFNNSKELHESCYYRKTTTCISYNITPVNDVPPSDAATVFQGHRFGPQHR